MAERLLQAGLDEQAPGQFLVESAGTGALVGNPVDPRVAGMIRVLGGSADNFAARQLTPQILRGQDLILTLTREHRSKVMELDPSMLRRTYTLREFARIYEHLELDESLEAPDRWRTAITKAFRARSAHTATADEDNVVDPYRRPDGVYQQMQNEIGPAIRTLIASSARP
ncbi:low molecular weight phosphatase family protein [Arthrobacter sp. Bz4]|nr:low molecular weight phosphatase family protein [Arthrobacter sp. Bz4]